MFADAYGWSANQLEELTLNEAITQLTFIEQNQAKEALMQRNLTANAVSLLFSKDKSDKLGRQLEKQSRFDPDEAARLRQPTGEVKELREQFFNAMPMYRRKGCKVKRDGQRN